MTKNGYMSMEIDAVVKDKKKVEPLLCVLALPWQMIFVFWKGTKCAHIIFITFNRTSSVAASNILVYLMFNVVDVIHIFNI